MPVGELAHHLLVVPDGVAAQEVEALVLSRYPDAIDLDPDDPATCALEVATGVVVDGPWRPDLDDLPGWAAACYRLVSPAERGAPVPGALRGRGGLLDAFADGEPTGDERALLELGLAAAGRLGGAVRTTSGALLRPEIRPDLLLYGEVWLHPDALVHVLADQLPGIAMQGEPVTTTPPAPAAALPVSPIEDEGERRWLHAEADAFDRAALADPDVTESYGVLATNPDGTVWSVTVEAAIVTPPALRGRVPGGSILYELRCYPTGPLPPEDAVERIDRAARALLDAVGGHVVDDDGFLVDLA